MGSRLSLQPSAIGWTKDEDAASDAAASEPNTLCILYCLASPRRGKKWELKQEVWGIMVFKGLLNNATENSLWPLWNVSGVQPPPKCSCLASMPSRPLSWIVLMTLLPFLYWYYSMPDRHRPHIPYPYTISGHCASRLLMLSSLGSLSLFSQAHKFFLWCRVMCQFPTPPLLWHGNFHRMRSSGAAYRVMGRMSIEESLPLSSLQSG